MSTVASQGLTDTEKSNARANIGAGTSNLALGSTATTAAKGNHTHNYAASSSAGGSASTLSVTETTPTSATTYYLLYATGKSGGQTVRANADLYYYDTGASSYMCVGSSANLGGITLQNGKGKYANLVPATSLTANHTLTMPNKTGTIATLDDIPTSTTVSG